MDERKSYELTQEEYQELQALRQERALQEQKQRKEQDLRAYRELVDDTITEVVPQLVKTSKSLLEVKEYVFALFDQVIEMKESVLGVIPERQRTHTFTTSDSTKRIIIGYNTVDGYLDTVEEGIEMVKQYLESLAGDEKSQTLVGMVLQLLSTDRRGNLKASRIVQLRKYAEDSGSEMFLEGVRVIEEAYNPSKTRRFVSCQIKDRDNAWRSIPLGMTDVDSLEEVMDNLITQTKEEESNDYSSRL